MDVEGAAVGCSFASAHTIVDNSSGLNECAFSLAVAASIGSSEWLLMASVAKAQNEFDMPCGVKFRNCFWDSCAI
jgi:hypothetical protein